MRSFCCRITMFLLALPAPMVLPSAAADCTFEALQWTSDGRKIDFNVVDGRAVHPLQVDVASGVVTPRSPRVADPSWNPRTQRVLCRDDFAIYELGLDGAPPRPLVFVPALSNTFVRALGCDAQGTLLLWTIARDTGEHGFWRRGDDGLEQLPGVATGPEALRWWEAHNVAQPFTAVGGQFTHAACVQRAGADQRLCVERLGNDTARGAPVFRLVLASAGRASVVLDRCVPGALGVNADSSLAVVGLFEEPDADGTSEVLSLWLSDFTSATRVAETMLAAPAPTSQRQRAWAHWLGRAELLWVDNSGQLYRVQVAPPRAKPLVSRAPAPATARTAPRPPQAGEEGPRVSGPDGSVAFTRHQRTADGLRSEIWLVAPAGTPRVLVPVWDRQPPVRLP